MTLLCVSATLFFSLFLSSHQRYPNITEGNKATSSPYKRVFLLRLSCVVSVCEMEMQHQTQLSAECLPESYHAGLTMTTLPRF